VKDRERWMDGEATELERLLLRSVADERPSRRLQRRMRLGIGLAAPLITLKAAAAALSVAALATGVAVTLVDRDDATAPRSSESVVPREAGSAANAPPVRNAEPLRDSPAPNSPAPNSPAPNSPAPNSPDGADIPTGRGASPESPRVDAEQRASKRTPVHQATAPADLREQMRLLDRARAALRAGEPRRALAELALYSERYPRGAFGQEATVLRVEALKQSGQDARAAALAREFVTRHADSPHVDRVSRVAREGKDAGR
jgi:hypothetical protein